MKVDTHAGSGTHQHFQRQNNNKSLIEPMFMNWRDTAEGIIYKQKILIAKMTIIQMHSITLISDNSIQQSPVLWQQQKYKKNYASWPKNWIQHQPRGHNFAKSRPIFKSLSPADSPVILSKVNIIEPNILHTHHYTTLWSIIVTVFAIYNRLYNK